MKIPPVRGELLLADRWRDGRADKHGEANSRSVVAVWSDVRVTMFQKEKLLPFADLLLCFWTDR